MKAYLDNSATTRCSERVKNVMLELLTSDYGNPSSMHRMGADAERRVREAREKIAGTLKTDEKEIYFTSGGTEANNMAVIGAAMANRRAGNHIITTSIEHPSVSAPIGFLEEQGFRVTYLSVDSDGILSLEELKDAVCDETILISLMMVNNEIGAAEPVEEAIRIAREKNPNVVVHVDAIQAYGKYRIYPKRIGIDLLSVSGHKIHGPKGVGFLFIKEKTKIKPIIYGGGQQKGLRSGTENVPGAVGLGEAAAGIYEDFEQKIEGLYQIRERLTEGLLTMEGVFVNGKKGRDAAPHIVSVSVSGVRSEVLLHALEERGVYVSAGSACASNKPSVSPTLSAIGLKKSLLDSTVRFSFSVETTAEEIDYALSVLREEIPKLRKYMRK